MEALMMIEEKQDMDKSFPAAPSPVHPVSPVLSSPFPG
jgi:hypothetical protein